MRKYRMLGLVILLALIPLSAEAQHTEKPLLPKHDQWTQLLQTHVDDKGWVNYRGFQEDRSSLNQYLELLANTPPDDTWGREVKLAYYINIYNAYTVELILRNYPVKSIKDIKTPWNQKIVKIGQETISLNDVEHKILRKMNEPRIHFAINCASVSCPRLLNEAITAEKLEEQLEQLTRQFLHSDKNHYGEDKVELSAIFKWFAKDFRVEGKKDVIGFINSYLEQTLDPNTKIAYLDYDWNLNQAQ